MRSRHRLVVVVSVLSALALTTGCMERYVGRARPRLGFAQEVRANIGGFRDVDLLLVVDDSGSMSEEQVNLAEEIPLLIRDLTTPPDLDADGEPDWGAAERLRIAIVNSDVGTAGAIPPDGLGDSCSGFGDAGQLHTSELCAGAQPGLQVYEPGDDAEAFATRIGCIVESLGTSGCGIEQQLEAGARGVEAGLPLGFPADDAILAVLVLTDEEDCSLADPDAFYSEFTRATGNVLCQRAAQGIGGARPEWLTSIDTLAMRLSAGRDEQSFVFAAITGIPVDLSGGTAIDILADAEMQYEERAGLHGLEPVPACAGFRADGTSLGAAAPARRIVELSQRFTGSVLHSICTDDFRPAIRDLTTSIARNLPSVCLTRAVPMVGDRVDCTVEIGLPAGTACDAAIGYRSYETREDGREVCRVDQVPGGIGGEGFFYDTTDETCAKLTFTASAQPPLGAEVTVNCFFEVPPDGTTSPVGP
ncbi:MAG: hypothetical protein M3Y87_10585 [Myxococcota bacterium]|nr:hypothetical protein [Myxococcota bacterium]